MEDAPKDYLIRLKKLASRIGSILIFDEITSGFRMCNGGIHIKYGINPDIAVFAKSIANGYAMAAIIGTKEVMNATQTTFISSTNWTERIGPVAAIATIRKYIREDVSSHIIMIGNLVKGVWSEHASKHDLKIRISGLPTLASFSFDDVFNSERMTFFTIEMLKRGFLGYRQFKPSFAHKVSDVEKYSEAVDKIFEKIAKRDPNNLLDTPVAHTGFKRLTSE